MKFLKTALLLNLVLMSNAGYAIEVQNVGIRSDLSGSALIISAPQSISVTDFPSFVLPSSGGAINFQLPSANWGVTNRVINTSGSIIVGGSISISSPLTLTTTEASISVPRITTLAATAVPEADTYLMLLAGLGLIGAIVARRSS